MPLLPACFDWNRQPLPSPEQAQGLGAGLTTEGLWRSDCVLTSNQGVNPLLGCLHDGIIWKHEK